MEHFYQLAIPLVAGYVLDLIMGDPRWFPHPVRAFGWLISKAELLNRGSFRFLKGALCTIFLVTLVFFSTWFLKAGLGCINHVYVIIFDSLAVYMCLANKSLIDEGSAVFSALDKNLEAGRKRLSWIVSRNTNNLTGDQVRIAVFESMSENLSDGVISPLFFYAVGGTPAMLAFKMISTLDSMIGYKNEQYFYFGKFAARLDDVANYLPARITAFLIALVSLSKRSFIFIFLYGNKHASPNAGYPEAALAGVLDCRFGGPNHYHGKLLEKPYLGTNERAIEQIEFNRVKWINHKVALVFVILIIIVRVNIR